MWGGRSCVTSDHAAGRKLSPRLHSQSNQLIFQPLPLRLISHTNVRRPERRQRGDGLDGRKRKNTISNLSECNINLRRRRSNKRGLGLKYRHTACTTTLNLCRSIVCLSPKGVDSERITTSGRNKLIIL